MKVSYKWLNKYFDDKLPTADNVAEILTMNSSEVDGIEKVESDLVLDVKILPNMAHSCLCHRGIAKELSVLLDLPMQKYSRDFSKVPKVETSCLKLQVEIENPLDCRRYIGRVIQGIKIFPSPEWLRSRLEVLGQRSINNLVDATNFVMLELGQPMHVFDADKIIGDKILIKRAKAAEQMKTLDGKQLDLDENVLTISNDNHALAIAGIKGGTLAEISPKTKNIVLESANFDPVLIRKTAQKLKIQTEASKRYENDLTPEIALEAMDILTKLIIEIANTRETKVGLTVDIYPKPMKKFELSVSALEVEQVLGIKISESEIIKIFKKFNFSYRKEGQQLVIQQPLGRLDLKIKEDLIEEIGRVHGYDKLKDSKIEIGKSQGQINKSFYYISKIKKLLIDNGFSEIYGYSFSETGDIELANSVAPDKKFLRTNLSQGLSKYLEFNARYSELIAMPQVKIFEIGKVFEKDDEHNNLAIGILNPVGAKNLPKESEIFSEIKGLIELELGVKLDLINSQDNILEINFDNLLSELAEIKKYDFSMPEVDKNMRFTKISNYPFMLRDVAVFTPEGTLEQDILQIIKVEAGELLVKYRLFDVFTKKLPDGSNKISYAYHLVFQSYEKTMSDEEANKIMEKIVTKLNTNQGWQVR